MKFNQNSSSENRVVQCGRADGRTKVQNNHFFAILRTKKSVDCDEDLQVVFSKWYPDLSLEVLTKTMKYFCVLSFQRPRTASELRNFGLL